MKKRAVSAALTLSALLLSVLLGACAGKEKHEIVPFGNEFEVDTPQDWRSGDLDSGKLVVNETKGGGSVELKAGETEAVYTSMEIAMPAFDYLVMSWNADAPEGTWVEVTASAYLADPEKARWSDYASWGKWSPFIKRASYNSEGADFGVYSDEMAIWGSPAEGKAADKVRLKVTLHRDSADLESPVLWYLHGTVRNSDEQNTVKVFQDGLASDALAAQTCEVEVPQYSQIVRSPNMGNVICNPTTTAMLLNSVSAMGGAPLDLLPEEVAMGCFDFRNNSFGNWAYAMAAAGSYGYRSYVDYSSVEGVKRHLLSGHAVGASVAYSDNPKDPDYLENAYGSTPGHLIVLRGFTTIDGVDYFISNDAYNPTNGEVRKLYRVDQFEKVWSRNTIYVVEQGKVEGVGNHPVQRVEAELQRAEAGKYAIKTSDGTEITIPQANGMYNSLHGFVAYTTEPEVFAGADTSVYSYVNILANSGSALPLTDDVASSPALKLYLANNDAYTGKLFVVN